MRITINQFQTLRGGGGVECNGLATQRFCGCDGLSRQISIWPWLPWSRVIFRKSIHPCWTLSISLRFSIPLTMVSILPKREELDQFMLLPLFPLGQIPEGGAEWQLLLPMGSGFGDYWRSIMFPLLFNIFMKSLVEVVGVKPKGNPRRQWHACHLHIILDNV